MNLQETIDYAIEQHGKTNGVDKTGKTPYYWHLLRVMLRIKDATQDQMKIAVLHDVLEDTYATEADLREKFGNHVTDNVVWCSKNFFKDLSFKEWMAKIGKEAPEDAILVKLADISDNLGFERMRGLMPVKSDKPYVYVRPVNPDVQRRVDSMTRKKMKLRGEMGVFDRYYIGWNLIMENPKNLALIAKIDTQDFIGLDKLEKLSGYIPKEQFSEYLNTNKIHTWKIQGDTKLHYDKAGQPYLAASVEERVGKLYQSIVEKEVGTHFCDNQRNRDNHHFHVTILNAAEFNKLKKTHSIESIVESFQNLNDSYFTYGIGKSSKKENTAYYVILENAYINTLREKLQLSSHDLHMTLGFEPKDVHAVRKNRDSVEFSNSDIWKHFVENDFLISSAKKNKLKF